MEYQVKQSGSSKATEMKATPNGYEDIETLFGLKIRVKKGTVSDQEIQMLSNLNRCLFAVGYQKVLQVPSNFEILSALRNSLNRDTLNHKNDVQKNQSGLIKDHKQKQENQQKASLVSEQRQEIQQSSIRNNLEEQKSASSEKKVKNKGKEIYIRKQEYEREKKITKTQNSEEIKLYESVTSVQQPQLPYQKPDQSLQASYKQFQEGEKQSSFYPMKPQPNEPSPEKDLKSESIPPTNNLKPSRLKGWFFIDRSREIRSAHSLQNPFTEKNYWDFLTNIWHEISILQDQQILQKYNITAFGVNQDYLKLKTTQAQQKKCSFYLSEAPYFLSTSLQETIQLSTIESQIAIYQPFNLRVIFTEENNTNCLRSLIFGLLFNALAFQKCNDFIDYLVSSDISISVKLVLFHIVFMKLSNKITNYGLAVNLSLLFRYHCFSDQLLKFFSPKSPTKSHLSYNNNVAQDFATQFDCVVVSQTVSPFGSTIMTTKSSEKTDNVIFLDITPTGCALNIYYEESKLNACMEVYQEKLGEKYRLPSI